MAQPCENRAPERSAYGTIHESASRTCSHLDERASRKSLGIAIRKGFIAMNEALKQQGEGI
jgi:hypothetical protein